MRTGNSLSLQEFDTIDTLKLASFTDAAEVTDSLRVESRDSIDIKKSCKFLNDAEGSLLVPREYRRGLNISCSAIDSREIQLASGRCGNSLNLLKFYTLIIPREMKF